MAKRIQLSDDSGSSWATLPGNSGEMSNEAGQLPDTIFGQDFNSNHPGLIGWQCNANGIFKGYAGYLCKILITGTSTATTDEACTLVSGKTYQITDAAKRILDTAVAVVVEDNGAPVAAANILNIDYLFGQVTFVSGYTVNGAVTITANYLPTSQVGGSRSFTLTQTADAIDNTTMPGAQDNDGHRTFQYGLKSVSLELGGVYATSNGFRANLISRNQFVIEINPDATGHAVARGFFRFNTQGQSGDVGALEEETVTLSLSVPDEEKMELPFKWVIDSSSTLNASLQKAITAWQDASALMVRYLPNGTAGVEGSVVITDLSLSGGLEAMNEFTVNMQGSDALDAVV